MTVTWFSRTFTTDDVRYNLYYCALRHDFQPHDTHLHNMSLDRVYGRYKGSHHSSHPHHKKLIVYQFTLHRIIILFFMSCKSDLLHHFFTFYSDQAMMERVRYRFHSISIDTSITSELQFSILETLRFRWLSGT